MQVISKGSAHPQSEDLRRLVSYWPLASFFEARASAGLSHCSDTGLSLKQRIVPVRNPCEVDAYGVASHELQAMPAPVPSAAVSRTTALHPTPSSHHGPVISLRHAVHCEGVLACRATSNGDTDLSRGSGGGRRRRDNITAAGHPRGAASKRLLASRGTTRAVLWKTRPG